MGGPVGCDWAFLARCKRAYLLWIVQQLKKELTLLVETHGPRRI